MDELLKLSQIEQILYFKNMTQEQFRLLLSEKEKILKMSIDKFNLLFLNINNECKKMIIDDSELFEKVMNIPTNRMGKTILDLIEKEIQEYIYHHPNLLMNKHSQKVLETHFKRLSLEHFSSILENKNLDILFQKDILEEVEKKFLLTENQFRMVKSSILSNKFKNIALFKIRNPYELFIYSKFEILVHVEGIENNYLILDGRKIKYEFIEKVNKKHIVSLMELLKEKDQMVSNTQLLLVILKLYMTFGLDDSKKVIQDFFTFSNNASLKRASEELAKDTRRAFRLKNQDKFYYYGMEYSFKKALQENNFSYFETFCSREKSYVEVFLTKIKKELEGVKDEDLLPKIKEIIFKEIQKREKYYNDLDMKKNQTYYQTRQRTTPILAQDIYQIFADIDLEYQLTKDGKIIPDKELLNFLLGNSKRDNACLLRMVFNKQALGLNTELYQIMNHFDKIKEIIHKDKNLSLYSILDVIDISKVFLYDLKPDELDISLETLSKILNSRKYCTEPPEDILKRVLTLHKKRKQKIGSAIAMIKGIYNDTSYKTVEFDDEELLVSGIDSASCLKVGGKGEDFLEFCLTNPKGLIFYIQHLNTRYILPCSINGNMLNINSIDPRIENRNLYNKILETISEIAKKVISDDRNHIELVTITDIHHEKFMNESTYESIYFEQFLPLGTDVYCDYNKKEVTNYIIHKKEKNTIPKYFDNQDIFYQERPSPYVISPDKDFDKERISILLNQIAYSSIEFLKITQAEKEKQRLYYNLIEVDDFIYIIGNQDWFIGITKEKEIVKYFLPYDKRAYIEYDKYASFIKEILSKIEEPQDIKREKRR